MKVAVLSHPARTPKDLLYPLWSCLDGLHLRQICGSVDEVILPLLMEDVMQRGAGIKAAQTWQLVSLPRNNVASVASVSNPNRRQLQSWIKFTDHKGVPCAGKSRNTWGYTIRPLVLQMISIWNSCKISFLTNLGLHFGNLLMVHETAWEKQLFCVLLKPFLSLLFNATMSLNSSTFLLASPAATALYSTCSSAVSSQGL